MKRSTLIVAAMCALLAFTGCNSATTPTESAAPASEGPAKGAIVYFNLDRVTSEYDMANDLRSVFETKTQSISDELNRRGNKLQSDVNAFQDKINKGLLTNSVAQAQNDKLVKQQNDFQTYYNQKQQEVAEEELVMTNQIGDAIKTFLDKFQKETGYAMIIATQGDLLPTPVCAGDPSLDVTDKIIEGLNADYIATKNNK